MAKQDISPDSLAQKTFVVMLLGAFIYITVVFTFIIGGNRQEESAEPAQAGQHD